MYKLISIDLDETLLNHYGKVSKEDKEAIKFAQEKGCIICINTGRNYFSSIDICKEISADYLIFLNGCYIYNIKKEKFVRNKFSSFLRFILYYTFKNLFLTNKFYGVKKLCKHLSIKMHEIVAIGDSLPDLKTIIHAGLGIAVLNSEFILKFNCDHITQHDNNNSAVAEAIYFALKGQNS